MKVISLLSGGLDSAVLMYYLLERKYDVSAVSIIYGQRHKKEIDFAKSLCTLVGVEQKIVDLSNANRLMRGSSLTDCIDVPHGHYEDPIQLSTVVPGRNLLFLSVALCEAISQKNDGIAIAAHNGDRAIYPDCREEFFLSFDKTASLASGRKILSITPFIRMTKKQIAVEGRRLGVPFDMTWSCYEGKEFPCGLCGACQERSEALGGCGW